MAGKKYRFFAIILVIWILFSTSSELQANTLGQNEKVTLKVAFYQLDVFFEYDENGNECGYGVDYLNELAKYANINWEYVPVDSWEAIGEMISNHEVDVRMPVSEPSTPSEKYSYTTEAILPSYHAIMTLKARDDLYYKDYNTISNLRIAITKGLVDKTGLSDYFSSIGITEENILYMDDYNACKNALEQGQADALISNVMDLTDDMKILDKFAVTKNYITTLKDSPYYAIINTAMTEMELENPSFQSNLYQKYYPDRALEPFTKEETEYMNQTKSLKVAIYPDRRPMTYFDKETNSYQGVAIDIANLISKEIGIEFEYVPITTEQPRDMLDVADLIMPVAKSGDISKYFITQPFMDTEILFAIRSGGIEPGDGAKVAVLSSTSGIQTMLEEQCNFEIVNYTSNEAALKALQRGKIDAFANSAYVLYWQLENPRYENLSVFHYQSFPLQYSLCGKAENDVLQSILNKAICSIAQQDREQIIKENTSFSVNDLTTFERLYLYRNELTMIVIIAVILVILLVLYNHSRTKYIEEIKIKSEEQERANQVKSQFLSRMSHDMRTPMNAILGMSYLGLQSESMFEVKEALQKVNESGRYLLGLINDSLDMSKIDSDKMELHLEPYLEADFVNSIKYMFQEKVRQKKIQLLVTQKGERGYQLMLDKLHIQQIFVNLINNAIKFSDENGLVELIIEATKIDDDTMDVKFIVRDHGCGMTPEFQKKMYEPFEQGARTDSDSETGTGLGLTIVKSLVELMKGSISCVSVPNQGTEFTVCMKPQIYHGVIENELSQNDQNNDSISLEGKRILLCEDHPLNIRIAVKLLEKEGMIVDVAENGELGLKKFKESEAGYYHAVLMDIRMPVMDGLEASKLIRNLNRKDAKTVPIIAMTANAFEDDRQKSMDAGMNAHLAKPIEPDILYRTMRKYCK